MHTMCLKLILEIIQTIAAVAGSIAVVFAALTYFNNKKKDDRAAAIDQVSFFRKEIIISNEEYVSLVRDNKGDNYNFTRVKLDSPTIEYTRKNFMKESIEQVELMKDAKYRTKSTLILNMLEELSLKIKHHNTYNHEALNSIKTPFVELVETYAIVLLSQREMFTGLPTYSTILEIYDKWKNIVDRRNPQDRQQEVLKRILESPVREG